MNEANKTNFDGIASNSTNHQITKISEVMESNLLTISDSISLNQTACLFNIFRDSE